jgi:hypothetical protein
MNIFSVLSMGKSRLHETSMSAMLAYLLNPNQDHGVGNKFLKSFLELSNENNIYSIYIEKIGTTQLKFDIDLEVQYYYNGKRSDIDVQIKIFDNNWNELHRIIIENKIKTGAANPKQLEQYYEAVINDENDENISEDKLSVIFITPDLNNKILEEEFYNLKTDKKTWIYWNSSLEDKNTVVRIIQSILTQEQNAEISPINEYMRHTFKAFSYFVNKTLDTSVNKFRFGENIGEIEKEISLEIDNKLYKLILRDSGQIQLFDENDIKVVARPLLKNYLEKNKIIITDKKTTRQYGQKIFEILKI